MSRTIFKILLLYLINFLQVMVEIMEDTEGAMEEITEVIMEVIQDTTTMGATDQVKNKLELSKLI